MFSSFSNFSLALAPPYSLVSRAKRIDGPFLCHRGGSSTSPFLALVVRTWRNTLLLRVELFGSDTREIQGLCVVSYVSSQARDCEQHRQSSSLHSVRFFRVAQGQSHMRTSKPRHPASRDGRRSDKKWWHTPQVPRAQRPPLCPLLSQEAPKETRRLARARAARFAVCQTGDLELVVQSDPPQMAVTIQVNSAALLSTCVADRRLLRTWTSFQTFAAVCGPFSSAVFR